MTSLANSLAGLSLLSGSNLAGVISPVRVESRAVRAARAQFTLPPVAPVWRQPGPPTSATAVLRLPSLIDRNGQPGLPPDVATAFTAYRALERLKVLADAGARNPPNAAALQERFARGLTEVEQWLASSTGDQLTLSFGRASRRADSVKLPLAPTSELRGSVVAATRDAPVAGLTGSERFTIILSRPGASDSVSVDLSGTPQPPRLDTIAAAFNQAIAALPKLGADGVPLLDSAGLPLSRYESRFVVVRSEKGWGLELRTGGIEEVGLRDMDARPSLLVAARQAPASSAAPVALGRFDLAASNLQRSALAPLSALDLPASAVQPAGRDGTAPPPLLAPLSLAAAVSDGEGFTYAVGTSSGSVGAHVGDGGGDLVLFKLDSRGQQVWQRGLGTSGSASGFSIALAPGGGVVVGGTIAPAGERDLLVARFGAGGEEEMMTSVRQIGDEVMQGLAVAADGSVVVGGRSASGALSLARVASDGKLLERQALDSSAGSQIRGLTLAPGGDLLLLTQDGAEAELRRIAPGALDLAGAPVQSFTLNATSLAVAADGRVAIGGQRGGDGAVALVDGGATSWTALASEGLDRVDQLLFDGGDLFVAGRTQGDLGAPRIGTGDAFLARFDAASGAIETVRQWGRPGAEAGPVVMSLAPAGDSAVHRLGFRNGILNPAESRTLVDQTALRAGDSFRLKVNGGAARTISIAADETAASFAERVSRLIGRSAGRVSVTRSDGAPQLRFEPAPGQRFELLSGPEGRDALAKLGLPPGALIAPPPLADKGPRVRPGGHYGLDLAAGLSVRDTGSARVALERLDNAIATVRAGFRSLYWDETKAALAEGPRRAGKVSPYVAGQLARYQDALNRLGG